MLANKPMGTIATNNILQVDVEDWYCDLDIEVWRSHEDRVVRTTAKMLDILKQSNTFATFYILGYVAEHHPALVSRIKDEGHEVGTHGYAHKPIRMQTPREFEDDLLKSIKLLGKITGNETGTLGYRAPQFGITEETSWVIDILKRIGLRYDSSIFPVKTNLYGVPKAPLFLYHISSSDLKSDDPNSSLLEIPLSVYKVPGLSINVPIAGGFYLRFFPYNFIRYALRKINKQNQIAVCYIHPWELDPEQPKIPSLNWYHYWRLSSTEQKFRQLLRDFKFTSVNRSINFG
jgi:polysaccharide deacetylase family protein (PEP-CTERM system associated)